MRIGVAKEIKPDEYRVALTPAGALELVNRGHEVVVETGAGVSSAFQDEAPLLSMSGIEPTSAVPSQVTSAGCSKSEVRAGGPIGSLVVQ